MINFSVTWPTRQWVGDVGSPCTLILSTPYSGNAGYPVMAKYQERPEPPYNRLVDRRCQSCEAARRLGEGPLSSANGLQVGTANLRVISQSDGNPDPESRLQSAAGSLSLRWRGVAEDDAWYPHEPITIFISRVANLVPRNASMRDSVLRLAEVAELGRASSVDYAPRVRFMPNS